MFCAASAQANLYCILLICCCNIDAFLHQCWNIYFAFYCSLLRCDRKAPVPYGASSNVKSRKVQVRKKTRKIICASFFFLSFWHSWSIHLARAFVRSACARSYCRKCNTIILVYMRSSRNEQRIGSFFRVSLVRCRAEISQKLYKNILYLNIYTHPAKEMISSIRKVRIRSLQCAYNLVSQFSQSSNIFLLLLLPGFWLWPSACVRCAYVQNLAYTAVCVKH